MFKKLMVLTGLSLSFGANAALLNFTVPGSGFQVQSYTDVAGSNASGAITGGNITGEAGFESIRLDVTGENLDILIDDLALGNPYFDANSGGKPGGLGSCRVLSGSAQCIPNSDDNLTISADELLSLDFFTDAGVSTLALFGEFTFRNDNHNLINGSVQVSHDGGSSILTVTNGIADLSVLGGSSFLSFNDQPGATQNYYISAANISAVPVPAAAWLFGSALLGLVGVKRKR